VPPPAGYQVEKSASSVMLETPYEAVLCHSPEDGRLNFPFCEILKISFGIVITVINLNS
jgi:hypothetical protein